MLLIAKSRIRGTISAHRSGGNILSMALTCEDETVAELDVSGDKWREECEKEVPEPAEENGAVSIIVLSR